MTKKTDVPAAKENDRLSNPPGQIGEIRTLPAGTELIRDPLSALFPDMPEDETKSMKNSLQTQGQSNPLTVLGDRVIDGWGRYRLLRELGMPLLVVDYIGNDPVAYVAAQNLHRRSLKGGQRLLVAAKMTNLKPGQKADPDAKEVNLSLSLKEAAKQTGYSESTIKNAKKIFESENTKLIQAVESETISVDMGLKLIDKDEDQIETVLTAENPKKAYRELFPTPGKKGSKPDDVGTPPADDATKGGDRAKKPTDPPPAQGAKTDKGKPPAKNASGDKRCDDIGADCVEVLFNHIVDAVQAFSDDDKERFYGKVYGFLDEAGYLDDDDESPDAKTDESEDGEDEFDDSGLGLDDDDDDI